MNTLTIPAHEVRADTGDGRGDFLAGLDHGYVVEAERTVYITPIDTSSRYMTRVDGDFMQFTFHTAEGDAAYLTVPADMPITVERGA